MELASVGRDGEGAQLDSVLGGSLRELAHAVRGATGAGREVHAAAGIPRSRRCLAALSKAVARSNVLADSELLAALIELSTPPPLRNSQASQRPALQHALRLRSMCRPCRALSCRVCFLRILFIPSLRLDSRQCQWHWHAST